jgi:hypothetical protein
MQAVCFYGDRATYTFVHPYQGKIDMIMNYRDMCVPMTDPHHLLYTFRVSRTLRHFVDVRRPPCPQPAISQHQKD